MFVHARATGVPATRLPKSATLLSSVFVDSSWSDDERIHSLAAALTAGEGVLCLILAAVRIPSAYPGLAGEPLCVGSFVLALCAMTKHFTQHAVHEPLHRTSGGKGRQEVRLKRLEALLDNLKSENAALKRKMTVIHHSGTGFAANS